MKYTAVIMAGGKGERFWPKSRVDMPKQFLSLTQDGKTMLQLTVERMLRVTAMEDVFIVTNANYKSIVQEQLPELPAENILCEPQAKNTAPCIAYAAGVVAAKYDDAIMCVVPSDHIIKSTTLFANNIKQAAKIAQEGENIVTIGVTPTFPETGYGYIKFVEADTEQTGYAVDRFVEKPNLETAKQYLADGNYLWNSGMFVWRVSTIMNNLKAHMPALYADAQRICASFGTPEGEAVVKDVFANCESVSVDYGIMEKAEHIYVVPATFAWDDVGSWLSLERINTLDEARNYQTGNVMQIDCENSILFSQNRLIAAIGVQNLIVVETDDVTLVCDKDNTQDVKKIVEQLRAKNAHQYL